MRELWMLLADFIVLHWKQIDALLVVSGLVIYVAASHSLNQRRHPSAAIAWVMGILLVPYVALPLYLAFGSRKVVVTRQAANARRLAVSVPISHTTAARTQQLCRAMGLPEPVDYSDLHVHEDGTQALLALKRILDGATRTLDVTTFILGRDVLGDEIVERLKQRARAGVKVRLLIDGIGIYLGGYPDLKALKEAGVEVVRFVPPFRSPKRGRTNLRNHRKMLIADGTCLWCGGRNLAAEYFEGDPRPILRRKPWLDLSFDVRGALATQARAQFDEDWAFTTEQALPSPDAEAAEAGGTANKPENGAPAAKAGDASAGALDPPSPGAPVSAPAGTPAQLLPSGPDRPDDTIYTVLVSAGFTSQKRILAVTPYFVPDASLLTALTLAARRGIEVDLLLPAHSNHRLADFARHRALRDLVAAGGRAWLHARMIHAKAVIIDDELALAGSANLDGRSLFLNYEMMVAFYDRKAVRTFAKWIDARRQEASPYVARHPGMLRELAEGLLLWLAFQL